MGVRELAVILASTKPSQLIRIRPRSLTVVEDADFQPGQGFVDAGSDLHPVSFNHVPEQVEPKEFPADYLDQQIARVDELINGQLIFTTFFAQQIDRVQLANDGIPVAPTWEGLKDDVIGGTAGFHVLDLQEVFYRTDKLQLMAAIRQVPGVLSCSDVMGAVTVIIDSSKCNFDNFSFSGLLEKHKIDIFFDDFISSNTIGGFFKSNPALIFVDINHDKYQPSDDGPEAILRHELYHYLVYLIRNFLIINSLKDYDISDQDYLSGLMETTVSKNPVEMENFSDILGYEKAYLSETNSRFSTDDFIWFGREVKMYSIMGEGPHWTLLGCEENIPLGKDFLYLMQRLIAIKIELDTLTGKEKPQKYQAWQEQFIDEVSWVMEMAKFTLAASQSLRQAYRQLDRLIRLIETKFPQIIPKINETVDGWNKN